MISDAQSAGAIDAGRPCIPTEDSIDTALDRMKRAGNFANNCATVGELVGITPEQIAVYIRAARSMLDDAERILEAVAR